MKIAIGFFLVFAISMLSCKRDALTVREILTGKNWYPYKIEVKEFHNGILTSDTSYFTTDCQKEGSFFLFADGRAEGDYRCRYPNYGIAQGVWNYVDSTKKISVRIPILVDKGSGSGVILGVPDSEIISYSNRGFIASYSETWYSTSESGGVTEIYYYTTTYKIR